MQKTGIVGWRGMVGSVLVGRMLEERDFDLIDPVFFSTSQAGGKGPDIGRATAPVADARSIDALKAMDIIISCQGGDYTNDIHPRLRAAGWSGYWIDAASALRMNDNAVIILDPVNRGVIDAAIQRGLKDYIGGNCTVSLMLIALHGLFKADLGAYRARLLDSPWVADAAFRRVLPSTIELSLTERAPMAIGRLGDQLFLVDAGGVIIDEYGPQYAQYDLPIEIGRAHV